MQILEILTPVLVIIQFQRFHFQIEYIRFIEAIGDKWLITDNPTAVMHNRASIYVRED